MLFAKDPGARPDRAKATFAQLVELWQGVTWSRLQPSSRARYEQVLRAHLLPEFGTSPVGTITRERVRDFLARLARTIQPATHPNGKLNPRAGQLYAPGTIHKVHTTLSAIMGEAVERGMLTANPCRSVTTKLLKPEHRKMDCLTPAEVLALADAIDPHYRVLILTAAYSGLRAGELHALRRRDVDLLPGRSADSQPRAQGMESGRARVRFYQIRQGADCRAGARACATARRAHGSR